MNRQIRRRKITIPFLVVMALAAFAAATAADVIVSKGAEAASISLGFNTKGNVLIADQFNNRVIEVTPEHRIVWSFGDGSSTAGPMSVVAPNDAERIGDFTLISGTGAPAGTEPTCEAGCLDNRVILVGPFGNILWELGGATAKPGVSLNAPVSARLMPNFHFLIVDQGNQRVIEVNWKKEIVWQYGTTGVTGSGYDQLNNPNSAELLANGDILIADESNDRVIEVNPATKFLVWAYGSPGDAAQLNAPAFASRLPNGDTLISDSGNNRIVEIDKDSIVLGMYYTNDRPGSVANPTPTRAVRLSNGLTLISDQFNDQVIAVTPFTHLLAFAEGFIGKSGKGPGTLNAPYDAKVIGEYLGLTKPPML